MSPSLAPDFRQTNRIFEEEVVGRGDFQALDRVYTRDARILPPGAPMISGRGPIAEFWKQAAVALGVKSVRLETVDIEPMREDAAVEIGRAILATEQGTAEVKYVVLWKKEDGAWKWHVDIWNAAQ